MVAEAHQQGTPVDEGEVRNLLARLVGIDIAATYGLSLDSIGIGDDLARFRVWQYAAEEFAERSVAEPDVVELLSARTADDLIEAIVVALSKSRHT